MTSSYRQHMWSRIFAGLFFTEGIRQQKPQIVIAPIKYVPAIWCRKSIAFFSAVCSYKNLFPNDVDITLGGVLIVFSTR